MSKEIAIEIKNLSKHFRLPTEKSSSIKQTFINWTRGMKGYKEQKVLRDISFNIEKGDFFGIVGRNGSGKSTLLKLISGIYEPDGGSIHVNGSLVSFIELGVGFNGELTGRENVYLNGALLGFSVKEIDAMYDEIVDFAELREFMDQKLKNYSSGMQVRLAFACAIRAKSDILVLDEVLAVGDEAFQRKCNDYFERIRKECGKTVVLVTHSMDAIKRYCSKALMIRDGEIIAFGNPEDVANEYSLENVADSANNNKAEDESKVRQLIIKNFNVELLSSKQISQNEKVKIRVSYSITKEMKTNVLVSLIDIDKNIALIGGRSKSELRKRNEKVVHIVELDLSPINDSAIKIVGEAWDDAGNILDYSRSDSSPKFIIRRTDYGKDKAKWAVLFNRGEWE